MKISSFKLSLSSWVPFKRKRCFAEEDVFNEIGRLLIDGQRNYLRRFDQDFQTMRLSLSFRISEATKHVLFFWLFVLKSATSMLHDIVVRVAVTVTLSQNGHLNINFGSTFRIETNWWRLQLKTFLWSDQRKRAKKTMASQPSLCRQPKRLRSKLKILKLKSRDF